MPYLNKSDVLNAYNMLSKMSSNPSAQGATQNVSALRYFTALDKYYKSYKVNCDTRNNNDRKTFSEYVGDVCSVYDGFYTSNFFYPLREHDGDYCVGSNFYSAGQVSKSLVSRDSIFDYPTRGNVPIMRVKNGVLLRQVELYKNVDNYLSNIQFKVAYAVWILRNTDIISKTFDKLHILRDNLSRYYTNEFIDILLPNEQEVFEALNEYDFKFEERAACISEEDIEKLFGKVMGTKVFENSRSKYRKFITAIKSKPFLLLAGISGTGKSRIVRELARACWDTYNEEYGAQKPRNFEMVQVKPNWHDSTELMGYVSRVSGREVFVVGDFLKFVARAWEEPEVPYFLCLDEMNLAPVEQYFAEYLSVIESRKLREDGSITTDPIIADTKGVQYEGLIDGMESDGWFNELIEKLTTSEDVRERFRRDGICLPQNLIVIGTVNMDETTYSFSRKVLDRAMTIEMNEFDLYGGLTTRHEEIGKLEKEELISAAVEGVDVYGENRTVCDIALNFLDSVNTILKGTPFSVAYRTRNELLLYVVNNLPYCKDDNGNELSENYVIARALDEITNMKILSRIEGDDTKVSDTLLSNLSNAIENGLTEITGEENRVESISLAKIEEMRKRLSSGYTSFWS